MTHYRPRAVVAALLALVVSGCGLRLPFGSFASSGSYFSTRVCGVKLDAKDRAARLHLTLEVVRSLPRGALVETEFQDTGNRSVYTVSRIAAGNERFLELVSPRMGDVQARAYETVTRVYASDERKRVLGSHKQLCQSLLDRRDAGPLFR